MHFVKIYFSTKVLKYYFLAKFGTFSTFLGKFPMKIINVQFDTNIPISAILRILFRFLGVVADFMFQSFKTRDQIFYV